MLILANKQDVKDCMTTGEISQVLTLSAIRDHPWHIQGCCALTGEGLVPARPGSGPPMDKWPLENPVLSLSCQNPAHSWLWGHIRWKGVELLKLGEWVSWESPLSRAFT